MSKKRDICLVVPTFSVRSSEIISELVAIVNAQSIDAIDIIIVNNNTFPLSITESLLKGKIHIINGKKNLGSAGGFYLGMKYAKNIGYDAYILGDDDASFMDDTAIAELVSSAFIQNDVIPYLYWKEKYDLFGKKVAASVSCYGCITHSMIKKLGFYSPFFFYGGEDGAYGLMAKWNGVAFRLIDHAFSHPMKPWLTYSRGSSGLSVFRHNSILQHYWTIAHSVFFLEIIRSFLIIYVYMVSVFYGICFFRPYFRYQSLYNLRNILLYIPPIALGTNTLNWTYPQYRDPSEDEVYDIFTFSSVDEISAEERFYHYSHHPIVVIDSWFPYLAFQDYSSFLNFLSHQKIYLLHGKNHEKKEIYAKLLIDFGGFPKKVLYYIGIFLALPFILIVSALLWILVSLKYLCIGLYMRIFEEQLFKQFH